MKKEVRWNLFRMATILQLLFSSLLSATLLFQSLRNPPKGELVWIITGWFFILLALAGLAAVHTHILYRYYPDRLVPRLLVTLRIIFTILSWVAVIILSLAFGSLIVNESAWEKFNLTLRIIFINNRFNFGVVPSDGIDQTNQAAIRKKPAGNNQPDWRTRIYWLIYM